MDRIIRISGGRRFFQYYLINLVTVATLLICIYLILPENIQKSLSLGLYILSAASGLIIGTLIAKLICLEQKPVPSAEQDTKKYFL